MTINDDMTEEAKKVLKGLKENNVHSLDCGCVACLFHTYKKTKPGKGRRYGKLMFFLMWLIHEVKMERLKKEGKVEEITFLGRKAWKISPGEYDKTPYIYRVRKILVELYADSELSGLALDLENLFSYLRIYKWRMEKPNFLKLMDELAERRRLEWMKTQPHLQRELKSNLESLRFAQRVADFIHSQPNKQVSQRDLLRHFSNKRAKDLEEVQKILKLNYGIKTRKGRNNKTVIYYSKAKNSKGIYWKVGL